MLLKIRTHVHIRVHILRVNVQVSNQRSDRVDADARIVQHRGKRSTFFREKKKRFAQKKIERKKKFRVYNPNKRSLAEGGKKEERSASQNHI